jgi:hydroxyacyl-ACP dehydratase HTD2-like protein with hotdog domain
LTETTWTEEDTTNALRQWLTEEPASALVTVTAQDIARYAIAIGASDPLHFDRATGQAKGHAGVLAPDTFYLSLRTSAFSLVPTERLHDEGTPLAGIPPISYQSAMAGETKVMLRRRFVADELVQVSCTRVGVARKQGRSGALTFVEYRYDYATPGGDAIATEHFTRIFR